MSDAFDQSFADWCARRKEDARRYRERPARGGQLPPGSRNPDGSYVDIYRRLSVRTPLPMPRVYLHGPRPPGAPSAVL